MSGGSNSHSARGTLSETLRQNERLLSAELGAMQLFQEISTRLIQADTIHALYELILDTAVRIMHADFASVQLLEADGKPSESRGRLHLLGWRGLHPLSARFWKTVSADSATSCGAALRTRERCVIADVEQCDMIAGTPDLAEYRRSGIQSMQSTPLISRSGQLLGVISTHWRRPYDPPADDLRWFDVLARQAADLVERKRVERQIAQEAGILRDWNEQLVIASVRLQEADEQAAADLRDMRFLYELSARLVTEADRQVFYEEILAAAISLTHADAGTVQVLDPATRKLVLLAARGFDRGMTERLRRVDAGSPTSYGIALATGQRAFVYFDVPGDADPDGSLRAHAAAGYLSAQSTPRVSRSGRVLGMFSTHWRTHHWPTERELRFLDLLARYAADWIESLQ